MPDVLDPELLEERARAERRASLPLDGVDWPTEMPAAPKGVEHLFAARAAPRGLTLLGRDVSHHNRRLDVARLSDCRFLFSKATEVGFVDATCTYYRDTCRRLGIPWGPYSFLRPGVSIGAAVKAWFDACGPLQPGDMRPAMDIEVPGFTAGEIRGYKMELERKFGCTPAAYIATSIYRQPGMAQVLAA